MKGLLALLSILLIAVGAIGFLAQALIAYDNLPFVSRATELPIYFTDEAIRSADGGFFVPHKPACRIQKYNHKGDFLFSFHVPCGGASIKLKANDDNTIDIATVKPARIHTYDLKGRRLSSRKITLKEEAKFVSGPHDIPPIHYPFYLLFLANPFFSAIPIVLGAICLIIISEGSKGLGE